MQAVPARNFHVPLPEPTYLRLKTAARLQKCPATQVVKQAIEHWLDEQERLMVHEQIAEYAAHVAGSSHDLDENLEAATLEYVAAPEEGQ